MPKNAFQGVQAHIVVAVRIEYCGENYNFIAIYENEKFTKLLLCVILEQAYSVGILTGFLSRVL